ncbi:hypothetical protein Hanom_Chr12g01092141 [Helianthus anomalus]
MVMRQNRTYTIVAPQFATPGKKSKICLTPEKQILIIIASNKQHHHVPQNIYKHNT